MSARKLPQRPSGAILEGLAAKGEGGQISTSPNPKTGGQSQENCDRSSEGEPRGVVASPLARYDDGQMEKDSLGRKRHPNQNAGSHGLPVQGDGGFSLVCPDWLGPIGKAEWHRTVEEMRAQGILSDKDGAAVELYAGAFEEYRSARDDVMQNGITIKTITDRGHEVERKNPATAVMNTAWSRAAKIQTELGLTPKGKLGAKEQSDPFEKLVAI